MQHMEISILFTLSYYSPICQFKLELSIKVQEHEKIPLCKHSIDFLHLISSHLHVRDDVYQYTGSVHSVLK